MQLLPGTFLSNISMTPHLLTSLKSILIVFFVLRREVFSVYTILWVSNISFNWVGLSPLRSHKWRHNFADTPSELCHCNQGNDTTHYLFSCPLYAIQRATLAASVINILQKNNLNYLGNNSKLYLYGHPSMNSRENKNILLATIKYIKDSLCCQISFLNQNPPPLPLFILWCCVFQSFTCIRFFFSFNVICCKFLELPWLWLNFSAKPRFVTCILEKQSIEKK